MSSLPAAVLWDMDGTLIDTEPYWIRCEQELVASYGGRWTDDDAKSIVGFDLLDAAEVIRSRGGVPLNPHDIVDRLLDGVIALVRERMPWRPGARELLAAGKLRGVPQALVTMSWQRLSEEVVRQLPPGSFQAVISGDTVMNGKPHPEPYRRAAEELGVDLESCVAIEDSPTGVASAEAAGCVVVAVEHLVSIPKADHRVHLRSLEGVTPEQLGDIVETTPLPPQRTDEGVPPPAAPPAAGIDLRGLLAFLLVDPRRLVGALAALLLLVVGALWLFVFRDTQRGHDPGPFNVHTWVPPWALDDALEQFGPNADLLHQVSPFWYEVTGVTTIQLLANTDQEQVDEFLGAARRRGVPLIPSLVDGTSPGVMAAVLSDPDSRAAHIDAIVRFAAEHDYDGIDIDYENFAWSDGRDTWETTRPNWVAFIAELGERLHADGRLLTVSVPPVYDDERTEDSGYWVYDYAGIVDHVDAMRIMAYDFSGSDPGPIAPLDWIEEIIDGSTEAAGGPEKLVLGIPSFGRNLVVATSGDCPPDAPGPQSPRMHQIPGLIERRNAEPSFNSETGEWLFTYQLDWPEDDPQCTQTREVHYLDAEGARQRMEMSIEAGFLGVALFAFGYQDDAVWNGIEEINATLPTTTVPSTTG